MSAQGPDLEKATQGDVNRLTSWFSKPVGTTNSDLNHARKAVSFINDYTISGSSPDVIKIKFRPESEVFWPISSESRQAMLQELKESSEANIVSKIKIQVEFIRSRNDDKYEPVVHSADWSVDVEPKSVLSTQLQDAIQHSGKIVSI